MIGVEAVDNILFGEWDLNLIKYFICIILKSNSHVFLNYVGTKEFTLFYPSLTNEGGAKNKELVYKK